MKRMKIQRTIPVKKLTIRIAALLTVFLLAFAGAGCLGQGNTDKNIVISGSTSVLPLGQTLSETYMQNHSDIIISIKGGGSGTGIAELIDGSNDIAMSSREIKADEVSNAAARGITATEHEIAKDGIAVIVHPSNPVTGLTLDQLQKIYSGEITNWNEVGGEDAAIAAIARDSSSGTQEFFKEAVMGSVEFRNDLITQSATGAVTQEVAQNRQAIGFIGAAYQNNVVKTVGIQTGTTVVMPEEANILNGSYPLARSLYLYTDNQTKQSVSDFLAFVMSPDGQRIVSEMGYAPVN